MSRHSRLESSKSSPHAHSSRSCCSVLVLMQLAISWCIRLITSKRLDGSVKNNRCSVLPELGRRLHCLRLTPRSTGESCSVHKRRNKRRRISSIYRIDTATSAVGSRLVNYARCKWYQPLYCIAIIRLKDAEKPQRIACRCKGVIRHKFTHPSQIQPFLIRRTIRFLKGTALFLAIGNLYRDEMIV